VTYDLHSIDFNFQPDIGPEAGATELSIISPSSPTTNTTTITNTPVLTLPTAAHDFTMISSNGNNLYDILYVTTGQDIDKFGLINGVWTAEGSEDLGASLIGITANRATAGGQYLSSDIYFTRDEQSIDSGELVELTDFGGPSGNIENSPAPSDLYIAPTGSSLSGVVVVPEPTGLCLLAICAGGLLRRLNRKGR